MQHLLHYGQWKMKVWLLFRVGSDQELADAITKAEALRRAQTSILQNPNTSSASLLGIIRW